LRLRRTLRGISQEKIGVAVGLIFQQIQKYERSANRASPSCFYKFSHVLDISAPFFIDDMNDYIKASRSRRIGAKILTDGSQLERKPDPFVRRGTPELVRA